MLIDWTDEYQRWRDRIDADRAVGNVSAQVQNDLADFHLETLQNLDNEPSEDTPTLMRVRQRGKFPLWRLSHPFIDGIAIRTVVWFPTEGEVVIVAIGAEKSAIGDLFYDAIGDRSDQAIENYLRARKVEK